MKKKISILICFVYLFLFPFAVKAQELNLKLENSEKLKKIEKDVSYKNIEKHPVISESIEIKDLTAYLNIKKEIIPLTSRLNQIYRGYIYQINSNYPGELDLIGAQILNGVSGSEGYINVEKSSATVIGTTLLSGFGFGFLTLGITFLVALGAMPFIYGNNHYENSKAKKEGINFKNQIPFSILKNGESLKFSTLVDQKETPKIKLTFRDINTQKIYSIIIDK